MITWQLYQFECTRNDKQVKTDNAHGNVKRGGLMRMIRGI